MADELIYLVENTDKDEKIPMVSKWYKVYFQNGVYLGDILAKEDGYYDFWPEHPSRGGYWASYVLRAIADKLDELNKPIMEEMDRFFVELLEKEGEIPF